jgi:hypothetical protein
MVNDALSAGSNAGVAASLAFRFTYSALTGSE